METSAPIPPPSPDDDVSALRPPGRLRIAGRILGLALLVPLVAATVLFLAANGWTTSGGALVALAIGLAAATFAPPVHSPGWRRRASLGAAALCAAIVLVHAAARLLDRPSPQLFRFVESGRRDVDPPWMGRLVDERETVMAGLTLSRTLGFIEGKELLHLDALLRDAYAPPWRPWPNAVLLGAAPGAPRHMEHVPEGGDHLPCLVFLHGFGGQLTAYLRVLHRAFGDRFVIVAPFLDFTGAFWTPDGKAAVSALVTRHLPPEVDPERVFLVGLSNGAAGAGAVLEDPALARRFRGIVLVSGIGGAVETAVDADMLVIAGDEDPRFPLDAIQERARRLRERGARVEEVTLPADHFLWLSHAREMTAAMDRWLSERR